ncbi:hypothetical protein BEK95_04330 [Enterococcus faecium]|nr:hypothetical protein OP03_12255 [Enterococcus faecium]TYR04602.1 hypothetical protein BEK95_04330 [Enterococcus faecium]
MGNDIPQGLVSFILGSICQFLFSGVIIIKNRKKSKKIADWCWKHLSTNYGNYRTSSVTHNHYTNIFRFLQD